MTTPNERITPMAVKTQKRAGGEKRGNKYDRAARTSKLSMAQDISAPIVVREIPARIRRNGKWEVEMRPARFREYNHCEHCGNIVSMLPEDRENETVRGEQDRIDPAGGYVMGNLQILCRECNLAKSDGWIG